VINNRQGWDAFLALVTSMNMQEVNNA
jgi:hypothetical protein